MRGLTPWGEQRRERSPAGKPRVNPSGQARLRFNPQRQLPTAAIPKPSYLSPYVERPHPGIEIHGTLVCCERRNSTRRGTFLRHLADGVPEVDRHHRSHAGIDPCRHPSAADRPRRHARSRGHKPAGVRAAGRVGLRRTSRGSQRRSALRHSRCAGVDDDRVGRDGRTARRLHRTRRCRPARFADRLATLGITVVTQPSFPNRRGDQYLADVDNKDVPYLWPCRSLLARCVRMAASTDTPFGPADSWAAIAAASTRVTVSGQDLGPEEVIPTRWALDMFLSAHPTPVAHHGASRSAPRPTSGSSTVHSPTLSPIRRPLTSATPGSAAADD